MSCLDEETIAAFVEARLPIDRIAALEAHAGACVTCQALVSLALAAAPDPQHSRASGADSPDAGRSPPSLAPASDPAALARGTSIGRYTVLGLVGRGGMGDVYAAYDPELDRKVALKVLNADAGRAGGRGDSRLLREAKAIARLRHPNVVVVHDAG